MASLNKQEFVERHGDPASFTFKGQCYDAGPTSGVECALCGRQTRFVYILKNPKDRSTPTGPCCFHYFQKWNLPLHKQLVASALWLSTTVEGETRDLKTFSYRADVQDKVRQWRRIKQQALQKIREYKATTKKEWLPEELFELQTVASKTPSPTSTSRWYDKRIRELQERIQKISS